MPRLATNVALHKPTRQSSEQSPPDGLPPGAQTSGGANDGVRTGLFGFHTDAETQPWWVIDLQSQHRLYEIRIYNRTDSAEAAAQANDLDVFVSSDGVFWIKAFTYRGPPAFGLDGLPLVVPVGQALPLRFVKLQRRTPGCLHLDEVEVYGDRIGAALPAEPPVLPPLPERPAPPPPAPAKPKRRVIHVKPRAGLGNRMLMYMAAAALQDRVPGAVLSNPGLPEWHFPDDVVAQEPDDKVLTIERAEDYRADEIARRMNDGALTYVIVEDYLQNVNFYPDPDRFRDVFRPRAEEVADLPTFADDEIVINIRASEILDGAFQYPLVPAGFYRSVVDATGLRPVLIGQLETSLYMESIKQALPEARLIPGQGAIRDFEMLRSARNIIPSVSTFSWLGAWFSHAETIHLPVLGFYHPTMIRQIDMLPLQDPRYRFYLLPYVFGVPEREALKFHRRLHDAWPLVPPSQLSFIARHAPFVSTGHEPGDPVDGVWYAHEYLDAAMEIAQGWYADPRHHYQAVGRFRGYRPQRPEGHGALPEDPWPDDLPNLALHRPALQSSICAASAGRTPAEDAARAVSGERTEPYACHTDHEDCPWWQVDLQAPCRINRVLVFNRYDSESAMLQAVPLLILISDDGETWRLMFRSRAIEPLGIRDGSPVEWRADPGTVARFVRVQLAHRRVLHLRQVEVYGLPAGQSASSGQ